MAFFRDFQKMLYKFGEEPDPAVFQNISIYADTIDAIRDAATSYQNYYVLPDERPDQVSYKLYGTADFHWTFYLMNPTLRECGWPLADRTIFEKAQKLYPETILTTRTKLTDKFKVDQTITGVTSGVTAKITQRFLDIGQLQIKDASGSFTVGETIRSTNTDGTIEEIVLTSEAVKYNSAHHYENADKEWVDIDPETGPGVTLTEVTWLDRLVKANDDLRQIRVIRNNIIDDVVRSFRDAVRI